MSEKTPVVSIVMFLGAAILGALGAYLYKSGAQSAVGAWSSYLLNPRILGQPLLAKSESLNLRV